MIFWYTFPPIYYSFCVTARNDPFEVSVRFDADEVMTANSIDAMVAEAAINPGGIVGFHLGYAQLNTNCGTTVG